MTALVIRGDARHLPLPDESVDLVVTSPPYHQLRSYQDSGAHFDGQIGSEATPAEFLEALLGCTAEFMRVLKPTGSAFVNLGDSYSRGQRYDNEFTFEDAVWLAGVLDSDGSISIVVRNDKGAAPQHDARIAISQKYRGVVDRISSVVGFGNVTRDEGKDLWRWQATSQRAAWVLERIWPWLILKRQQALAAVELVKNKQGIGTTGGARARLTDADLHHRESIRQAVLAWNRGETHGYEPPNLPLPDLPRQARWLREKTLCLLPERYRIGCVDRLGLIARAVIVLDKKNGLPESVTDRVRRSHEDVVHLTKQPRYYSAVDEIREEHAAKTLTHRGGGQAYGNDRNPDNHWGNPNGKARIPDPLGKLPGSVWEYVSEPFQPPTHLGIDHFAAFATSLPKRLIRGWSPPGICVECGEGRRPIATATADYAAKLEASRRYRTQTQPGWGAYGGSQAGFKWHPGQKSGETSERTILGYVCACTPHTDHPGTGETSGPKYWVALEGGSYATKGIGGEKSNLSDRPKTGPWREYHFDRWTPAPTRPSIILDPFSGTGTTTLVASALGRIGIGVDLSHDYCRLAQWRTTDRAQIAKVLEVPKPPVIPKTQLGFDFEDAS